MLGWMRWQARALALVLALCALPTSAQPGLRVATWNVLAVGAPGTPEYDAALAILRRLDADIVAINEVSGNADTDNLRQLQRALGYAESVVAPPSPFGGPLVAFLSHYPLTQSTAWTSPMLSGDPLANDLSRNILEVRIEDARLVSPIVLLTTHWKSGATNGDEFRRAIESRRMGAVVGKRVAEGLPVLVMGDVNADIDDPARVPAAFTAAPSGLPITFSAGADIVTVMGRGGLANDPFGPITSHVAVLEARQRDGTDATRPASGRRIDYIFAAQRVGVTAAEVFDCVDDAAGLPGTIAFVGAPVLATDCAVASDHLPVVADVVVLPSPPTVALTVTREGTGFGTVTSEPAGIACGKGCSARLAEGETVTLLAAPATGSRFEGWGGACAQSPTNFCTVSLTAPASVSASFVLDRSSPADRRVQRSVSDSPTLTYRPGDGSKKRPRVSPTITEPT